jgi:hypothetical protein
VDSNRLGGLRRVVRRLARTSGRCTNSSGTVTAMGGLLTLAAMTYHFRGTALAVWRYAFTVPATSDDETSEPAGGRAEPRLTSTHADECVCVFERREG